MLKRTLKRNAAIVVVAAVVVGVGAYAWAQGAPSGPSLSANASAGAAASSRAASGAAGAKARVPGALLRRVAHGDLVVRTRNGFENMTYDAGRVTAHSASSITVQYPGRDPVTLTLDSSTRYRGIHSADELQDGKAAAVLSQGGTAKLVVQRGNRSASASVGANVDQVPAT
jgi:hypothetical protein